MDENKELELVSKMNLLPSERVGLETKLTYQHRLVELQAEGYLTEGEYNARMEWLDHADTRAKLDMVFRDLPRITVAHRSAYEDYLTRKRSREQEPDRSVFLTTGNLIMFLIYVICGCIDIAVGGGFGIVVGIAMLLFSPYWVKRAVRGH